MKILEKIKSQSFYDIQSGFSLDWSKGMVDDLSSSKAIGLANDALRNMQELESGSIANPDEERMVGHYWLRDPELSPDADIKHMISLAQKDVLKFVSCVHSGEVANQDGLAFQHLLLAGIGGSALGPQLLDEALSNLDAPMDCYYLDNTDPAGLVDTMETIPDLSRCLCVVISKSGGTRETRNAMLWVEKSFAAVGVNPAKNMVAVTQEGSRLYNHAKEGGWLKIFPMWDWVGGRVSLWSAVGLLPAALVGINVEDLLAGAAYMDSLTRSESVTTNPALILALHWYLLGGGKGERNLVMLPYRDQLEKLSKYMQQLVMESLGKAQDLNGQQVNQGLSVFGNKGSTDQHSYVQQLRDGSNDFIAHFVEVLNDSSTRTNSSMVDPSQPIDENVTAGDYLLGFLLGTRSALYEAERPSLLISIKSVTAFNVGMLLALFERSVGFYASFINVNAYHQPGVEAGKKAAERVIEVQQKIVSYFESGRSAKLDQIIEDLDLNNEADFALGIVRHLAANGRLNISQGDSVFDDVYSPSIQ